MVDFLESIEACVNGKLKGDICDKIYLQVGMMAELDAINLYETIAHTTQNKDIKKMMLDIANEEKTHFGEFEYLRRRLNHEWVDRVQEGWDEVAEKTQ